jgi:hypothetical protein
MDTYNILTKVYACGHEGFVPVPEDKWDPSRESVHFSSKCDNCNFPKLLQRFRLFNNPSNKLVLSTVTSLAYEMFDSRQCLSVENIDALMRHWIRGIQCQLCEEAKHRALFDGLAQSVAEQDGLLAGKEMRALLESGYIRFAKNGRGYSRPVSRMRPSIRTPRIAALSSPPSSSTTSAEPLSPTLTSSTNPLPSSVSHPHPKGPRVSSPLASGPLEPDEIFDESPEVDTEGETEEENACRLRLSLERLHGTMKEMGLTEFWGKRDAQADSIDALCDSLQNESQSPAPISKAKQAQVSKGKEM